MHLQGVVIVLLLGGIAVGSARAGAVIETDDETSIELGFRLQPQIITTEADRNGDGSLENETEFKLRRARLYLKGRVTKHVTGFLQTDAGLTEGGTGRDWRIIDAWVSLTPHSLSQLYVGQQMVPSSRQGVTTMTALMAIDRPGINYKALTWGTRSMSAFANRALLDADSGLRGDVGVRDTGATLFGAHSVNDRLHLKYYAGVYDGIQFSGSDNPRLTGRGQVNIFDAEGGYFNKSTYLGKKRTLAIGASFDSQQSVAASLDCGNVDYQFYTVDIFGECPLGPGHLNIELAYEDLDLGGTTAMDHDGNPDTAERNATQAEGSGYYAQSGYLMGSWQPWIAFEHWDSEDATDRGTYDAWRVGITYYISGYHANIRVGFEQIDADTNIGATADDRINSFVAGCYLAY